MKKIDDFTVIGVVTCGQGYQNEWAGNLIVGDEIRHEGFNDAASLLEVIINEYTARHNIKGKKKIWLNGMSRAAAIANIAAADLIESGEYEDVYAYLFGVPRTTKEPIRYKGIYNICGQFDPVADTPLQSWGYERYGTDLFTPSQESDSEYAVLAGYADKVSRKLTGKKFRNNPEINYQLRLILEFFGEFFPSSSDYASRFQSIMLDTWKNPNENNVRTILQESIMRLDAVSKQEETSRDVFIEYLSYIAADHLRANQRQVETGGWELDESLAANAVIEHRPSTYVKWLFSGISPEQLFLNSISTRKLVFVGDVGVDVFRDGVFCGGIDNNGNVSVAAQTSADLPEEPVLFMMRKGEQTVINLPAEEEYSMEVNSGKFTEFTYYDQIMSSSALMEGPGRIHIGTIGSGLCTLNVVPGEPLDELIDGTANYTDIIDTDFQCLPSVIMANELQATKYTFLTLGTAIKIVTAILLMTLMTWIMCLIVSRRHRRKIKQGHRPYSDLYIIIPHVFFILIFMVLTQYLTFFLFTIGKARAVCASITMLIIFFLSFRGFMKYRGIRNAAITLFMLILVPLTHLYYRSLPIDTFSYLNMSIYFATVLLLTGIATITFRHKEPEFIPQEPELL